MDPRRAIAPVLACLMAACAGMQSSPPEVQKACMAEGEAALAAGRREAAIDAFSRAIEAVPEIAEPYARRASARIRGVVRGEVADEAAELALAVEDLNVALRVFPLHSEASFNRGLALAALSRYREAAQDLEQASQAREIGLRRDAHAKLAMLLEEKFVDLDVPALRHYDAYAELGGRDAEVLSRGAALRARAASAAGTPEDEAAARALIEEARGMLAEGRKDLAGELLGRVVRRYAKTRAASREAAPLLKDLEGKK